MSSTHHSFHFVHPDGRPGFLRPDDGRPGCELIGCPRLAKNSCSCDLFLCDRHLKATNCPHQPRPVVTGYGSFLYCRTDLTGIFKAECGDVVRQLSFSSCGREKFLCHRISLELYLGLIFPHDIRVLEEKLCGQISPTLLKSDTSAMISTLELLLCYIAFRDRGLVPEEADVKEMHWGSKSGGTVVVPSEDVENILTRTLLPFLKEIISKGKLETMKIFLVFQQLDDAPLGCPERCTCGPSTRDPNHIYAHARGRISYSKEKDLNSLSYLPPPFSHFCDVEMDSSTAEVRIIFGDATFHCSKHIKG